MTDFPDHSERRRFLKRVASAGLAIAASRLTACAGTASPPVSSSPSPGNDPARSTSATGTRGELDTVTIRHASGSSAEIAIQGAHVTSWKRTNGEEMLFVSANSRFAPGQPIRGGIPVVFPQFAALGPLPGHGFLRTATWEVADVSRDPNGAAFALFQVRDTDAMRTLWPHPFRATLRVTLDEALATAITIENVGDDAFPFHCALHTYLRVGDLTKVSIRGLEGATYQDRRAKNAQRRESRRPLRIEGETDRLYVGRPERLRIRDESLGRTVFVDRIGFNDVVIWNPGEERARTSTGLAEGEYLTMLAVESAQVVPPVQLAPKSRWTGVQRMLVG